MLCGCVAVPDNWSHCSVVLIYKEITHSWEELKQWKPLINVIVIYCTLFDVYLISICSLSEEQVLKTTCASNDRGLVHYIKSGLFKKSCFDVLKHVRYKLQLSLSVLLKIHKFFPNLCIAWKVGDIPGKYLVISWLRGNFRDLPQDH